MAAYSLDLRERIVEAVERHVGSKRQIAALFGVHESFLYQLLRQQRERGDIAPLPHGGGAQAKLSPEQRQVFPELIAAMPDATLAELRVQLKKTTRVAVSLSTVCRGLQALGLSRKKSPRRPRKPIPTSGLRSKRNNRP
jgi:transposase